MSLLTRRLKRAIRSGLAKETMLDKISEKLDLFLEFLKGNWYYNIRNYLRNIVLFNKLAWNWRSWDSEYSVMVFIELLKKNATTCKNGNNVLAEKVYRRGMTMAGKLEKAYSYSVVDDKAYMYIAKKYPFKIENHRLNRGYATGSVAEKISDIAHKRIDDTGKALKADAWQYVNKYIAHIWD